jgi:hypothetical protein
MEKRSSGKQQLRGWFHTPAASMLPEDNCIRETVPG